MPWCSYVLSVGLLSFTIAATAQTSEFDGKKIVDIQFDPAPVPLAGPDLDRVMPLHKGTPFQLNDASRSIDGLYATGRFEDIQVDVQPSGADGVVVRFLTRQTYFIGHVSMEGKAPAPPNRGQLINVTQLTLGTKYRGTDLSTAQAAVKNLLEANGLYQASVQATMSRDPRTQTVNFEFDLKPGKRARYSMPEIRGTPLLAEQTILRATGWRFPVIHWWYHVTQDKTRNGVEGIEKKYQKQDRLLATVKLDSLDYDASTRRAKAELTLDPGPKVEIKAVEAKVSKGRLKKYVPVYDEGTVDNDLLVEGARNLRDYFQSQGYYDVTVDFRQLPPAKDRVTVEYTISKGNRYKLVKIEFRGNKYFPASDFTDRMFLETASWLNRHGRYSEAFRNRDASSIANLYKSNGFRDVKVTSEVQNSYRGKTGDIAVIFHVEEGAQWFVDSLTVSGIERLAKNEKDAIMAQLSSSAGQPYTLVNVAQDRNVILTAYYSHGFPEAEFGYKVENSSSPQHVKVSYQITENRQEFVREVVISGLRITRPSLVKKHIALSAGDELAPTRITDIQRKLYDLGIFAKVEATVQNPDGATDHRYVLYDFQEADRYSMAVGVGAEIAQFGTPSSTTLANPAGSTGFSPSVSLDVSRLNFLGIGHTIAFRSLLSNLEQRLGIDYTAPRFMGVDARTISFRVLYDEARDVRTFSSRREEASVQVSQKLTKAVSAQFQFAYRRVSTSDVVIPTLLVPELLQPVRIGIFSMNLIQDRRDDPADAHRGMYNSVELGLAANFFGSQRNFGRVLFKNATYTPIGSKLVFARQTQVGLILPYNPPAGISATDSVPLPERFFGGGANSDRAFPFNQAGPRDIGAPEVEGGMASEPTGFPIGGNALFFNTFELRFPLIGSNIGGVLFHDAGNVYQNANDISFRATQRNLQDFDYMVHAVGFGIRYKTPVGPLRVDLAYSINPPGFYGFNGTIDQLLACNPNLPPSQLPGVCTPTRQSISHFQFVFSIGQAF